MHFDEFFLLKSTSFLSFFFVLLWCSRQWQSGYCSFVYTNLATSLVFLINHKNHKYLTTDLKSEKVADCKDGQANVHYSVTSFVWGGPWSKGIHWSGRIMFHPDELLSGWCDFITSSSNWWRMSLCYCNKMSNKMMMKWFNLAVYQHNMTVRCFHVWHAFAQ